MESAILWRPDPVGAVLLFVEIGKITPTQSGRHENQLVVGMGENSGGGDAEGAFCVYRDLGAAHQKDGPASY